MNKDQTKNKEAGIPTLEQLKHWRPNKNQKEAAELIFLNMAHVDTIKPIVKKYQQEILDKHKFKIDGEFKDLHIKNNNGGDYVLNESESYLMNESDFTIYLKELHQEHLKHGFNVKYGYCPLLMAESNLREAKRHFINLIAPVFGIKGDQIISLKNREKFLDIGLTLVTKHINTTGDEIIKKYLHPEAA